MTFIELVEEVARRTMKTKESVKDVIKEMSEVIEEQVLVNKGEVAIPGFGRFSRRIVKGGVKKIAGNTYDVVGRDTLKFKSYATKEHK